MMMTLVSGVIDKEIIFKNVNPNKIQNYLLNEKNKLLSNTNIYIYIYAYSIVFKKIFFKGKI